MYGMNIYSVCRGIITRRMDRALLPKILAGWLWGAVAATLWAQSVPVGDITSPGDEVVQVGGLSPDNLGPAGAIDDNPITRMHNNTFDTGFIVYPRKRHTVVTGIGLTSCLDNLGRDPVSYALYGSNDGIQFDLIHGSAIPAFSGRLQTKAFMFPNTRRYYAYKLLFPSPAAPPAFPTGVQIAEVELLGVEEKPTGGDHQSIAYPMAAGNSIALPGNGAHVEISAAPDLSGLSFTIEFWARRYNGGLNEILFHQGQPENNSGLSLGFSSNGAFIFDFGNDPLIADGAINDSLWHHWAATFNANTRRRSIYRDGVQVAEDTTPLRTTATGPMILGANALGAVFHGQLDEFRIWSRELPKSEIEAFRSENRDGSETGLEVYYRFDESEGDMTTDHAGKSRNGLLRQGVNRMWSGAFPDFRPSGDWRELKLLWPLRMNDKENALFPNGRPYLAGSYAYVALASLEDHENGRSFDYGGAGDGHNGMDVSGINYRSINNDSMQILAMADGILLAKRDGLFDRGGSAEIPTEEQAAGSGWELAGRWRLDEGAGTLVGDQSPRHAAGTIIGTGWSWQLDPARGRVLNFTGNSHIRIPSAPVNFRAASFTIAAWIKTTQFGAPILSRNDGENGWAPGEQQFFISGSDSFNEPAQGAVSIVDYGRGYAIGQGNVADGKWHHVAFSVEWPSGRAVVYVDGQPDPLTRAGFFVDPNFPDIANAVMQIGYGSGGGAVANLVGSISDVVIYKGMLPADRIAGLMAGQSIPNQPDRQPFTVWTAGTPNPNVAGQFDGSGNCVYIMHSNGFVTQYAHLKKGTAAAQFRIGDFIPAGTPIGVMGSSGTAGHLHLHFGVDIGRDAFSLYPERFHPTLRTNQGLDRFSRREPIVEPFFEEPGTGETMWAPGQQLPPYDYMNKGQCDIYDTAISVVPIRQIQPGENPSRVPLNTPIYVFPSLLPGQGQTRVLLQQPGKASIELGSYDGQSPAFTASVSGDNVLYCQRRTGPEADWETRAIHHLTVLPQLARAVFSASTIPSTSGTIGTGEIFSDYLRVGDNSLKEQRVGILNFDPILLPPLATVEYAELHVPYHSTEGISPWDRGIGWGGQMFVELKDHFFGISPLLDSLDGQDSSTQATSTLSRSVASGETSVAIVNAERLSEAASRFAPIQFRLRFEEPSNLDGSADTVNFAHSPRQRASIVVYYTTPIAEAPTFITPTSATLNGSTKVAFNGEAWLEWGETTTYGQRTGQVSANGVEKTVSLSAAITGLFPGTEYHYRVASQSPLGIVYSEDQTFATPLLGAGHAGQFSISTHVEIPELLIGRNSFTIEAWVRQERFDAWQSIFAQGVYDLDKRLEFGFTSDNQFFFSFGFDDLIAAAPADWDWHHWACRFDAETLRRSIFLDGRLVASDISRGLSEATGSISIGSAAFLDNFFVGRMDELRIWNAALDPQVIAENMNRHVLGFEPNLMAQYSFNQQASSPLQLLDSGPDARHGVVGGPFETTDSGAKLSKSIIRQLLRRQDGTFELQFAGHSGLVYRVLHSKDMRTWTTIGVATPTSPGNLTFPVPVEIAKEPIGILRVVGP